MMFHRHALVGAILQGILAMLLVATLAPASAVAAPGDVRPSFGYRGALNLPGVVVMSGGENLSFAFAPIQGGRGRVDRSLIHRSIIDATGGLGTSITIAVPAELVRKYPVATLHADPGPEPGSAWLRFADAHLAYVDPSGHATWQPDPDGRPTRGFSTLDPSGAVLSWFTNRYGTSEVGRSDREGRALNGYAISFMKNRRDVLVPVEDGIVAVTSGDVTRFANPVPPSGRATTAWKILASSFIPKTPTITRCTYLITSEGPGRYLVVGGLVENESVHESCAPPASRYFLARITADGAIDSSFGTSGVVMLQAKGESVDVLRKTPDGHILIGGRRGGKGDGRFDGMLWIERRLADGTLDTTFSTGASNTGSTPGTAYVPVQLQTTLERDALDPKNYSIDPAPNGDILVSYPALLECQPRVVQAQSYTRVVRLAGSVASSPVRVGQFGDMTYLSPRRDRFVGTTRCDDVFTNGGDDLVQTAAGDDRVFVRGRGNVVVHTGAGDDQVRVTGRGGPVGRYAIATGDGADRVSIEFTTSGGYVNTGLGPDRIYLSESWFYRPLTVDMRDGRGTDIVDCNGLPNVRVYYDRGDTLRRCSKARRFLAPSN